MNLAARILIALAAAAVLLLQLENADFLLDQRRFYGLALRWVVASIAGALAAGLSIILAASIRNPKWAAVALAGALLSVLIALGQPGGQA